MIEFDETLSKRYTGKEALIKRMETRLLHTTHDIPYYDRGVDVSEFVYGSQTAAIKLAFKDLGPDITLDSENSRIQYYDITVDVSGIMGETQ
ncbi:MAG: hypothetical protein IKS48_07340 [Eubacterium sp.]|nr:hypothetical protein [Methanobrevibacter sp.]MBR6403182.1 hypothetical protein [Eubacterium sp.]